MTTQFTGKEKQLILGLNCLQYVPQLVQVNKDLEIMDSMAFYMSQFVIKPRGNKRNNKTVQEIKMGTLLIKTHYLSTE